MPKPSEVYAPPADDTYLDEKAKIALALDGRQFHLTELQLGDGEYGLVWDLTMVFTDTGEVKHMFMGASDDRQERFSAYSAYLAQVGAEPIGPFIYQRGRTKKGNTWSDITDA